MTLSARTRTRSMFCDPSAMRRAVTRFAAWAAREYTSSPRAPAPRRRRGQERAPALTRIVAIVVYNAGSLALAASHGALTASRGPVSTVTVEQENAGSLETARKLTELGKIPDIVCGRRLRGDSPSCSFRHTRRGTRSSRTTAWCSRTRIGRAALRRSTRPTGGRVLTRHGRAGWTRGPESRP
jgi:hypothetical protein